MPTVLGIALLTLAGAMVQADERPADRPPDYMPLGAYLSWERPPELARMRGIDRWDDVAGRLDLLVQNSVDTIWVSNLLEEDLPRLIHECEKRGLRLIALTTNLEIRAPGRAEAGLDYYRPHIARLVKTAGDSKALAAWVISDEPENHLHPFFEQVRQLFGQFDPNRPAITVSTPRETPNLPLHSKVPVLCVDPYPFFAAGDPNGPHTEAQSIQYYRQTIEAMMKAIGDRPTAGWVMGQAFAEIWGPQKYDQNGRLIGLPGAYLHWRCPTPAEVRWQIWEAFRAGGKGMFFFTATPMWDNPANASLPSPDVAWKEVFAKEPTDVGFSALTTPDGSATPQLKEMGKVFGLLKPHGPLIVRWKADSMEGIAVSQGISAGCFIDPDQGGQYLVLVNDRLTHENTAKVKLPAGVRRVEEITQGKRITPTADSEGRLFSLLLRPGEGAILHLITQ